MIELDGVSGFSSLVVADDAIYIRTEGKVIELRREEEAADSRQARNAATSSPFIAVVTVARSMGCG